MSRNRSLVACVIAALVVMPVAARAQHHHHGEDKPCHPTPEQVRETQQLYEATKAAAKEYENPADAMNDDFIPWVDSWKPVFHLVKYENYYDWKTLDPKRPEALVYAHTLTGVQLIGFMYSMEDPDRPKPDFGGCIANWHRHPQCKSPIGYSHIWEEDWGGCPPGWEEDPGGSELMLHVWTVPMKGGPYAMEPDPSWECWPQPSC